MLKNFKLLWPPLVPKSVGLQSLPSINTTRPNCCNSITTRFFISLHQPNAAISITIMCPSGSTLRACAEPAATTTLTSDFRPAFDVLDKDRDGKISKDDLRAFYAGFSSSGADENLIGSMMSAADSNKDGFVQYDEFERVLGGGGARSSGGVMEDVFKVMDKDGDGKLSHEDLKSYLSAAGFAATDEDIKAMIILGGGDDNQGVSYAGLLKILAVEDHVG